jgi:hypothetical protein
MDQWQAFVNTVMSLRVPWKGDNFLTSWAAISFSRSTLLHGGSKSVGFDFILCPHYSVVAKMLPHCSCITFHCLNRFSPCVRKRQITTGTRVNTGNCRLLFIAGKYSSGLADGSSQC